MKKQFVIKIQSKEVQEIIETQRVIEEFIVANADAINQIKQQMANNEHMNQTAANPDRKDFIREVIKKHQDIGKYIFNSNDVVNRLDQEIKVIIRDKKTKGYKY